MQEINELKNLVIQSLEGNGVLGQIRAQIRASVFKIIEMQETVNKKNSGFFWENPLCQTIYDNKEGQLALELINDFLEFFKMDYTHSVFTHESNLKDASKKDDLQRKLGLKSENNKPVLFQLIAALTAQPSLNKENESIASTKPNTATSAAASKTFGASSQDTGAGKTSFDNFGRGSKGGLSNLDESQEEKADLARKGGKIPPLNSYSPQGNAPQSKQPAELSAQEAKRQAIEDLKKPIGEFNKQGYLGGYKQQQKQEEEEEEQEEEEEENYDDEVFENVEEELVEDLEEEDHTGRDKKAMYNSSEDIIGASQSQGFDVSVDSLALEDYDYFENAERERPR